MVKLTVSNKSMDVELRGSDNTVISELSLATVRILDALEKADGNDFDNNLTYLVLKLLSFKDERDLMKQSQEETES